MTFNPFFDVLNPFFHMTPSKDGPCDEPTTLINEKAT